MTIDLDELERLAKAATPGPWYAGEKNRWQLHDGRFIRTSHDHSGTAMVVSGGGDADFIAAANPETVLALVERVRALEKEREEDQGVIRVWRGRTERAEELLRDALASDLGWEDTEWGPKAAKIVGEP